VIKLLEQPGDRAHYCSCQHMNKTNCRQLYDLLFSKEMWTICECIYDEGSETSNEIYFICLFSAYLSHFGPSVVIRLVLI